MHPARISFIFYCWACIVIAQTADAEGLHLCLQGIRIALTDGASHAVDSSEMAFKLACQYAFREAFGRAKPVILEPVMDVDVRAPVEFQGTIIGDLNRRKGVILNSEGELDDVVMKAQVPLASSLALVLLLQIFPMSSTPPIQC